MAYEGLHHAKGPWCTIGVYRQPDITVIVATDESDTHEDCSITNRIERVMYLAWEQAGRPWPCAFVEHYEHKNGGRNGHGEHFDLVEFANDGNKLLEQKCWSAGRDVGPQFTKADWSPLRRTEIGKGFVLPPQYGRKTS